MRHSLGIVACVALSAWGCASSRHEASSPATVEEARAAHGEAERRKVARLDRVPSEVIATKVDFLVASGNAEQRERARTVLLDHAAVLSSDHWRDGHREDLASVNASKGWSTTPAQLEAQLALWQLQSLTFVMTQLERLGGPRVRAFAFELLEDTRRPNEHRQLALALLSRDIAPTELAERARLDALAQRIPPPPPGFQSANAIAIVGGLRAHFKRCYNALLGTGVREGYKLQVRIEVGADGSVSAATVSGGAPESLASCVRSVAGTATFIQPKGGHAVLHLPLTFVLQ